tara:strand:- start:179 stop:289 length:111 start_codon:yes stop_codon:yes gene_type:complete
MEVQLEKWNRCNVDKEILNEDPGYHIEIALQETQSI